MKREMGKRFEETGARHANRWREGGVESQSSTRALRVQVGPGPYKVREEREVRASDERAIAEILGALGLAPRFRYEKYRSTYRLPGIAHVVVELDETPIGDFLELEGRPRGH